MAAFVVVQVHVPKPFAVRLQNFFRGVVRNLQIGVPDIEMKPNSGMGSSRSASCGAEL